MIGVIVWSSAAKRKAVIWCEDQGPLAYLHGLDNVQGSAEWPATGCMVSLESEIRNELRHAFNVRVIDEAQMAQLPGILREVGGAAGGATTRQDRVVGATSATGVFGGEAGGNAGEQTDGAGAEQAARPALRVVSSQDNPQISPDASRDKQPALFAVKTAAKLR